MNGEEKERKPKGKRGLFDLLDDPETAPILLFAPTFINRGPGMGPWNGF